MKILVLEGNRGKGKTTTIWLIRDLLGSNSLSNEFEIFGKHKIPYKDDFRDIICYNQLKVALYSMGDYSTYLTNAIYHYS